MSEEETEKEVGPVAALASTGTYLGIESTSLGFVVVSLNINDGVLTKREEFKPTKYKAQALEGFKKASGRLIIEFNQKAAPIKKG